jgi:DNA-binding transcriptional regulator YiaG
MTRSSRQKSEASAAIWETAVGLFEAGLIDRQTLQDFDKACDTRDTKRALTDVRTTDTPDADTLADDN